MKKSCFLVRNLAEASANNSLNKSSVSGSSTSTQKSKNSVRGNKNKNSKILKPILKKSPNNKEIRWTDKDYRDLENSGHNSRRFDSNIEREREPYNNDFSRAKYSVNQDRRPPSIYQTRNDINSTNSSFSTRHTEFEHRRPVYDQHRSSNSEYSRGFGRNQNENFRYRENRSVRR